MRSLGYLPGSIFTKADKATDKKEGNCTLLEAKHECIAKLVDDINRSVSSSSSSSSSSTSSSSSFRRLLLSL